jgi:hypothetical protein
MGLVNATLRLIDNIIVNWEEGTETASTLLNGDFDTDAQGRVSYDMQTDGLNSMAAFRAAMYNQLCLANVTDRGTTGATDPANWV